jgi:hypothetical protein
VPAVTFPAINLAANLLHSSLPDMPTAQELLGILIAVLVIWFVLKMMKVAIKLILFVIGLLLAAGLLYFLFAR